MYEISSHRRLPYIAEYGEMAKQAGVNIEDVIREAIKDGFFGEDNRCKATEFATICNHICYLALPIVTSRIRVEIYALAGSVHLHASSQATQFGKSGLHNIIEQCGSALRLFSIFEEGANERGLEVVCKFG